MYCRKSSSSCIAILAQKFIHDLHLLPICNKTIVQHTYFTSITVVVCFFNSYFKQRFPISYTVCISYEATKKPDAYFTHQDPSYNTHIHIITA
ncbi:MAG: hypothetical protein E7265_08560 [Lachnospiraceae bacterium]|nr:hypothetical protein [Lachnospiraceae bacterium]